LLTHFARAFHAEALRPDVLQKVAAGGCYFTYARKPVSKFKACWLPYSDAFVIELVEGATDALAGYFGVTLCKDARGYDLGVRMLCEAESKALVQAFRDQVNAGKEYVSEDFCEYEEG
jgi:hypothetical protein